MWMRKDKNFFWIHATSLVLPLTLRSVRAREILTDVVGVGQLGLVHQRCGFSKQWSRQVLHFTALYRYCFFFFKQVKVLWQSCLEQVYWHHFSTNIFSLRISVSHFGNFHNIFNFFNITTCVTMIYDQWLLMLLL